MTVPAGKILFVVSLLIEISCAEQDRYPGPLLPDEALKSFQLRQGFKIELFASEPSVQDPVEMVFDEQGNAFVAEMPDYPFMPEQGQGKGRIRVLRDTDGDGQIDDAIIFADSILEVTSMLPWKGGLIITAAPDILYLKDNDGDMRADETEILFTGFFENNSEAQITSLRFGIDNWIYAANNGQAGSVRSTRKPDAPELAMGGADFRFRLDRNEFELESGNAQFGHTMDDWGNRFITQNTLHIRQVVTPWRYLHRHAHLPSNTVVVNISDHELEMFQQTPPPYWRAERTRRRQIQYKEQNLDRVEYAEDHFTGCSGGTVYDGDAFPPDYYGNVFTGDVAGNLIHRDILISSKEQPLFIATRDDEEKAREFLTSTDPWFRPAGFTVGPDGFLYVIDMYRQHIETPLSIPEDLKEDMDFLAGSDKGRIYRILPEHPSARVSPAPRLRNMSSVELVKFLTSPNRWWRLQAQRMLLERQDTVVVPAVKDLFSSHEDPRVRLHALYVLEGLSQLSAPLVEAAMEDAHPGIRRHGLMLSERFPKLQSKTLEMLVDSSLQVVYQAALSAGNYTDKRTTEALADLLALRGADPLFRTAVLSAKGGPSVSLLEHLIKEHDFLGSAEEWKESWFSELSYSIGSANNGVEVGAFLDIIVMPAMEKKATWQIAAVSGLKKGLQKSSTTDATVKEKLESIQTNNAGALRSAIRDLRSLSARRGLL